jgi:hypothetical protein
MEFRTPPSVSALSASVPTLAFFGSTTGAEDANLLALAEALHSQGYDWRKQFENFPFTQKTNHNDLGRTHNRMPSDLAACGCRMVRAKT